MLQKGMVCDANILIAALIKNGITVEILSKCEVLLYVPDYVFEEILSYSVLIERKSNIMHIRRILTLLKSVLIVISNIEYGEFIKYAETVSPDIKDVPYLALCLKLNIPLWSNDKVLKNQNEVLVLNTKEVLALLEEN